ncbi:MAG TPA: DUF5995 family protein [Herpetosiphonaceae bacterium]|nr:DUF5995 family protein [Herpetosiphonaceae bacterium]
MPIDQPLTTRMETLVERLELAGDARCVFLRCYAMMTARMLQTLDEGGFYDTTWVRTLLDHFENYYFAALDAYECGAASVPAVWKRTHALAGEATPVLVNLLLGINAHINYDLALAIADLLAPAWSGLSPAQRHLRYEDHVLVNQVIARTIDEVQQVIAERYAHLLGWGDAFCGPVDEWITAQCIGAWRDDVWEHVLRLVAAGSADERETIRQEIETAALRRVDLLTLGENCLPEVFAYPLRELHRLRLL